MESWFGKQRAYHFSDDLLPGSLGNSQSFGHLRNVILNDSINDVIRATALLYLENVPSPESSQLIVNALSDPNEMVRQSAFSALIHFPDNIKIPSALKGLDDEYKGVRIMAFRSLIQLDPMELSAEIAQKWKSVLAEYETYLKTNADFPNGQILLGEYYQQIGDSKKAEQAYKKALAMDSFLIPGYSNLAILYSGAGSVAEVKKVLDSGIKRFPEYGEFYYYLGLNEAERGNNSDQLEYLLRAYQLEPENPKFAYNYILSEYTFGNSDIAKNELKKALTIIPENSKLLSLKQFFEMDKSSKTN